MSRVVNGTALCGTVAALCLGLPPLAAAHGGMWRANRIHIAPDDPARIVLQSDLRGPIFSSDGGRSWRWICAESYGRSSISAAPVAMVLRPRGRLLVATYGRGVQISDTSPCTFTTPPGFTDTTVRDLVDAGDRLLALGTEETSEAVRDVLFVSDDGGDSFRRLGAALPADFTATSLRAGAPPSGRLYVAGLRERGWTVARSDDGGQSWTFGALIPFESRVGWGAAIVDVDPARPDVLLVLRDEYERNLEEPSGDMLLVSEDGGASFRPAYADGRPLHGVARAPDGTALLVGGETGLYRAAAADAASKGASAFTQLANTPFYGLTWTPAGIYAGMEEFSSPRDDAYSVGFSEDGGTTFTRRMSLCETQAYSCAPDTKGGALCPAVFSDDFLTGGGFKEDFLLSDRCVP